VHGLTMDCQLTLAAIARRAETLSPRRPVIAYGADGSRREATWSSTLERAKRLAVALRRLGVVPGDRVATLCWNQQEHLEAYFGIPLAGAVVHTLNARLPAADLAYVLRDGGSRVLIVDETLLDIADDLRRRTGIGALVVIGATPPAGTLSYDELIEDAPLSAFAEPSIDERSACALCHTTGTTGAPKGVLYSHRALALQSLALLAADLHGIRERDTVMIVVPMFHANAWGHPYAAALAGASLVLPHRHLGPETLLERIARDRVTVTGGVPSVWEGVLGVLERAPGAWDTSSLRLLRLGGARASVRMLRAFEERHGIPVVQSFGMTELSPMGGMAALTSELRDAPPAEQWAQRSKQGRPVYFLEMRVRAQDGGLAAWDGVSQGELELRGPSVAAAYHHDVGCDAFTDDGWLRTGDVVTIDRHGFVEIRDRAKDLIKSGGEWISSVALEAELLRHPDVADAAVVAIADARWQERPLAIVVPRPGARPAPGDLRAHLLRAFPRWWVPDRYELAGEIPRTAMGKIRKHVLRERFGAPS
jgi:fatty-acyl-CoA synthase